jgi:hypothetical protein
VLNGLNATRKLIGHRKEVVKWGLEGKLRGCLERKKQLFLWSVKYAASMIVALT